MRPSGQAMGLAPGLIFSARSSYTISPVARARQVIRPGSRPRYTCSPTTMAELPAAVVARACHLTCVLETSPLPVASTALQDRPPRPASVYSSPEPNAGEDWEDVTPRQNQSNSPVA